MRSCKQLRRSRLYIILLFPILFIFVREASSQSIVSYKNDFNTPTSDFDGLGFSIKQENEFNNPAIHSVHPYPVSPSHQKDTILYYEFKKHIIVNDANPIVEYDEIVLTQAPVQVQIFHIRTQKWITLSSYTSTVRSVWNSHFNSNIIGWNSLAIGNASLFQHNEVNLMTDPSVKSGDEVILRFSLNCNWWGSGWGWAIDNLSIQPDIVPPLIYHYHFDYVSSKVNNLLIEAAVIDGFTPISDAYVEYKTLRNDQWTVKKLFFQSYYFYSIDLRALNLKVKDTLYYRIRSIDQAGNSSVLPEGIDAWKVVIKDYETPVKFYYSNFDSNNPDFVGNYFNVAALTGYPGKLVQTPHPYPNGFGPNIPRYSVYTYTLMKPIIISGEYSKVSYKEALLLDYGALQDYAGFEGSRDYGETWEPLVNYYNPADAFWRNYVDSGFPPTKEIFVKKEFDLRDTYAEGEVVILRFVLYIDGDGNKWGWAFDDLSIQTTTTDVENQPVSNISVYPVPSDNYITIDELVGNIHNVEIVSATGETFRKNVIHSEDKAKVFVGDLADGVYTLRINLNSVQTSKRIIIRH